MFRSRGKALPGIFATQDENLHRILKKPVSAVYSMSNLVSFEPYVDNTMRVFCSQLKTRFAENSREHSKICDLGEWLQMFAFDVIGEITFSKRLGFLDKGEDVDGIMSQIWNTFRKTSLVRLPSIHKDLLKSQIMILNERLGNTNAVARILLDK